MSKKIKRMGLTGAVVLPEKSIRSFGQIAMDVHLVQLIKMGNHIWKVGVSWLHHGNWQRILGATDVVTQNSLSAVNLKDLRGEDRPFILTRWRSASRLAYVQVKMFRRCQQSSFSKSDQVPNAPLDLGVHQLIDRRDWHSSPGFQEAFNNERDGLRKWNLVVRSHLF